MADRHHGPLPAQAMPAAAAWEKWRTRQVAQRRTDRFVTDDPRIKTRPLPASFQLLGATAAMWVLVEAQLVSLGVRVDLLLAQGLHPRVVMEVLGHSQIALTMNTYSHVMQSLLGEAARSMEHALWGETS